MTRLHWRFQGRGPPSSWACLLSASPVETAKPFAEWTAPVNLGEDVNSAFNEFLPSCPRMASASISPPTARGNSVEKTSGSHGERAATTAGGAGESRSPVNTGFE